MIVRGRAKKRVVLKMLNHRENYSSQQLREVFKISGECWGDFESNLTFVAASLKIPVGKLRPDDELIDLEFDKEFSGDQFLELDLILKNYSPASSLRTVRDVVSAIGELKKGGTKNPMPQ